MSAIRITAEPGHVYLMKDGERALVTRTTAHTVTSEAINHSDPLDGLTLTGDERVEGRSIFETHIESVLH